MPSASLRCVSLGPRFCDANGSSGSGSGSGSVAQISTDLAFLRKCAGALLPGAGPGASLHGGSGAAQSTSRQDVESIHEQLLQSLHARSGRGGEAGGGSGGGAGEAQAQAAAVQAAIKHVSSLALIL